MNIDQINGNRYTPQKSGKGNSISKTNSSQSHSKSVDTGSHSQNAANVSLSEIKFDNEIAFAKSVLGNLRQESFDSLKNIKQNIEDGAYDSKEIHQKISSLVKDDLSTLTHIFSHSANNEDASPTISDDHKNQLLNNPDVAKKVSENILNDLQNI